MKTVVADIVRANVRGDAPALIIWAMVLADFLRNEAVLGTVCALIGFAYQIWKRFQAKREGEKLSREMQFALRAAYLEGERAALVERGILTKETGNYKRVLETVTGELEARNE
jgi:threonine/homoserine/homoserine lactone efflux protein